MHKTWSPVVSTLGTILSSLLSCAACPACLPIYAGILSFCGVELFEINTYFFPIMLGFLAVTLLMMLVQVIRNKADFKPLLMCSACALIVVWSAVDGKEMALYLSLAGFMASVFWNKALLKKKVCGGCCKQSC